MNCDMQTPVFAFPSSTFHCFASPLLYLAWHKRSDVFRRFLAMAMIKQAVVAYRAWRKRSNKFRRFLAMAMIKQAFIAHLAWRKR